jgi:hypothetical protein
MVKKHLYIVTGGLGKNVLFTSILDQLYEKHNDKICIEATYPNVFQNNPFVSSCINYNPNPIISQGFKEHYQSYETINGNEPYHSDFLKKQKHLITSYQELNNIEIKSKLPILFWNDKLEKKLENTIKSISPFIMLQFSGGSTGQHYMSNLIRDYAYGQELINKIKTNYPNLNLLVFGHDNIEYENTLKINFQLTEQYFILAKYALTFISVDSALQHFASNERINKKGIVLWGETFPEQFGYEKNINLLSSTPHVVEIEPNLIVNKLKEII